MFPASYNPTAPEQFIGPARQAAEFVLKLATLTVGRASYDPLRILFSGPPGVGKSKLAALLVQSLGGGKWNVTKLNGTQLKIEEVEDVARSFHLRDLFGGYRLLWIEELDKMPAVARSRLLTLCDDMPPGWALVGTTNLTPEAMKKVHEPTARRYTFIEVGAPSTDEVLALLRKEWSEIPEFECRMIAVGSAGCVGAALQEADAHFVSAMSLPTARLALAA